MITQVTSTNRPDASAVGDVDAVFRATDLIGDAWSWLVLREAVLYDARRFSDFLTGTGAPRSTLASRLAALTDAGLLSRESAGYVSTPMAEDFLDCLLVTMRWGDRWLWSPDAPPQRLVHIGHDHDARAGLLCCHCGAPLRADDVVAARSPVEAPNPPSGQNVTRFLAPDVILRGRPCSIARALTVFGDRWSGLIIRECFFGTRRFDDFERRLGIAPNILSNRMRRLVDTGFIRRVPYQDWPVRHAYELTEQGRDFYHMPIALMAWGRRWLGHSRADATMTHIPCGQPAEPILGCLTCGDPMDKDDIAVATLSATDDYSPLARPLRQPRRELRVPLETDPMSD
jgi:DNA-binding HxlR family transcriptional regulator